MKALEKDSQDIQFSIQNKCQWFDCSRLASLLSHTTECQEMTAYRFVNLKFIFVIGLTTTACSVCSGSPMYSIRKFWIIYNRAIYINQKIPQVDLLICLFTIGANACLQKIFYMKFSSNSYSHPQINKAFWKGSNNKQSWNHSSKSLFVNIFTIHQCVIQFCGKRKITKILIS